MFNKKYFVAFLIPIFIALFNLLSDVKIDLLSLSLVEFREISLNCGNVYQIIFEGIEYTDQNLRIHQSVCYNNAVLKILNVFLIILFTVILYTFGIKYISRKSNAEDLSDLLNILRRRNKRDI